MQQVEIQTYKRLAKEMGKGLGLFGRIKEAFSAEGVLQAVLVIMLSQTVIFGGLAPFGVAFFSAYVNRRNSYLLMISLVLGALLSGISNMASVKYIVAMLFYTFVALQFSALIQKSRWMQTGLLALTVTGANVGLMMGSQIYIYDVMLTVVEVSVCVIAHNAFALTHVLLPRLKQGGHLQIGELVGGALTIGLALVGVGGWLSYGGFSAVNVVFVLLALVCAYEGGVSVGAAVGVVCGILAGMSPGQNQGVLGSFALGGLLCGFLGRLGKTATCLAFIIGNSIMALYASGSTEILISIYEIFAACAIFAAIPKRYLHKLGECLTMKEKSFYQKERDLLFENIGQYAGCYKELGDKLFELSEKMAAPTALDASAIFDRVTARCCASCSLKVFCWKQEFATTYDAMNRLLLSAEKASGVNHIVLPKYLSVKCRRPQELLQTFKNTYELYRLDKIWQQRLNDARFALSGQLDTLGQQLMGLAQSCEQKRERLESLEREAQMAINQLGIYHNSIEIYEKDGVMFADLSLNKCGDEGGCKVLTNVLSDICGVKMQRVNEVDCKDCRHKFVEAERFAVDFGAAATCKQGGKNSGDSFCHDRLPDGSYAIALSDGMGSGKSAQLQSMAAASLLVRLLKTGFDKLAAINLVNSLLICKSIEASFATIDLCIISLKNGKVEFYKSGAAPAFVCRDRLVDVCEATSMPAGLLTYADVEKNEYQISDNDCVVLMTDGAFAAGEQQKEDYVSVIGKCALLKAGEIAHNVYKCALQACKGNPEDDLTVICVKILANGKGGTGD